MTLIGVGKVARSVSVWGGASKALAVINVVPAATWRGLACRLADSPRILADGVA
jgi:hypothetical protein